MNEKELFSYKSHCELIITSKEVIPDSITEKLSIVPTRQYHLGQEFSSKHSGTKGKRFQNLWAIKSETINLEEESISQHVSFFKSLLKNKTEVLADYKTNENTEVTFWVWIETDNASFGFDLDETEMFFINSISNRVHFSVITKTEISH